MQFFRIKKVKDKNFKSLIFRERKRKYEKETDTYISKRKPIIIYGKAAAGKSKELLKIWDQKDSISLAKIKKASFLKNLKTSKF